jgi:hypothetical protein
MRRISILAVSLVLSALGLVGVVSPAGAASTTASQTASSGVGSLTAVSRSITTDGVSVQIVITCTISVDNPHHSSHVDTTIRVFGRIACTAPVSSLASALTLVKDGVVAATNSNSNAGVAALANAVVVPCVNGAYIAVDEGLVIFPAGFVPPGGYIRAVSNPAAIANCP